MKIQVKESRVFDCGLQRKNWIRERGFLSYARLRTKELEPLSGLFLRGHGDREPKVPMRIGLNVLALP